MQDDSSTLLRDLEEATWFLHIGQPLKERGVLHVTKWIDAVTAATGGWWEMISYRQSIALQDAVVAHDKKQMTEWKRLDRRLHNEVRELTTRKVSLLRAERGFPSEAEMILAYQIRHAVLETEFLGMEEPMLFRVVVSWLLRGRYACGLNGRGRLMVY